MQMFYPKTDSNQQANMNWIYTKIKLPTAQDADINGNVLGCFGLLNQITYVRLIQWNFICHKLGYYAWCSVPTTATLETTELEKDQLEIAKIVFAFAQQTPTTDTAQTLHRKLLVRGRELGTKEICEKINKIESVGNKDWVYKVNNLIADLLTNHH